MNVHERVEHVLMELIASAVDTEVDLGLDVVNEGGDVLREVLKCAVGSKYILEDILHPLDRAAHEGDGVPGPAITETVQQVVGGEQQLRGEFSSFKHDEEDVLAGCCEVAASEEALQV